MIFRMIMLPRVTLQYRILLHLLRTQKKKEVGLRGIVFDIPFSNITIMKKRNQVLLLLLHTTGSQVSINQSINQSIYR